MDSAFLIVGLGNPGEQYRQTRHNFGFMVVDHLAERLDPVGKWRKISGALTLKTSQALLVKPQTFVNRSGAAVASLLRFFKLPSNHLIVIHDEADLELGKVKLKFAGSSAGHRGIESIDQAVGRDYWRVRLGISRLVGGELTDHVLQVFSLNEQPLVSKVIDQTSDSLIQSLSRGDLEASNLNLHDA